eukprot:TRINITY_DN28904_c0_g1_i1.p1 TRINITY_DN28904_c0_g1~~TRINITY_DN28904_c0_g1_i1.p1  ORF type:complete len:409 (-),score=56.51 TRINITY_DN28904_c0_g1_i1:101-1327(-)
MQLDGQEASKPLHAPVPTLSPLPTDAMHEAITKALAANSECVRRLTLCLVAKQSAAASQAVVDRVKQESGSGIPALPLGALAPLLIPIPSKALTPLGDNLERVSSADVSTVKSLLRRMSLNGQPGRPQNGSLQSYSSRLMGAISKGGPPEAPLTLACFVHHSSWANSCQLVDQLLGQPSYDDLDPSRVLNVLSGILWNPRGCSKLWHDPTTKTSPEPLCQLSSQHTATLIQWMAREAGLSPCSPTRLAMLFDTIGNHQGRIHSARQSAQQLITTHPSAASILEHLELAYPGNSQPASWPAGSTAGGNPLDQALHRLLVMLPSSPGTLVYRKLRHHARRFPHAMLRHLGQLSALVQVSAVEQLSTWTHDTQSNGKAIQAADLLLRAVGLLDALRPVSYTHLTLPTKRIV